MRLIGLLNYIYTLKMKTLTLLFSLFLMCPLSVWGQSADELLSKVSDALSEGKDDYAVSLFRQAANAGEDRTEMFYWTNVDKSSEVAPRLADEAGVYYEIDINVKESTYSMRTYSVTEATNPMKYEYGKPCFDRWENGESFIDFYIGWGGSPQDAGNQLFAQDKNNPHLFYYPENGTWTLEAGEEMNFIISNYHPDGWWDHVEWRCDDSQNVEKFGYFSKKGDVNPNWEGTNQRWEDGSMVGDNWMKPTVTVTGNYRFEFDAHLGRGKIVPAN